MDTKEIYKRIEKMAGIALMTSKNLSSLNESYPPNDFFDEKIRVSRIADEAENQFESEMLDAQANADQALSDIDDLITKLNALQLKMMDAGVLS